MKKLITAGTATAVAAMFATVGITVANGQGGQQGNAQGDEGNAGGSAYTIALFGDMPYNQLGRDQYPNLLADINRSHVAFSVFDGDLKAGGDGGCVDSIYTNALHDFNTLKQPLVFLPGDNDWTDCWGRYGATQQPFF